MNPLGSAVDGTPPAARRFRRAPWRSAAAATLLVVLLAVQAYRGRDRQPEPADRPGSIRTTNQHESDASAGEMAARVLRVVDGDTLVLSDRTRLRLIGVDTPETVKPDWPVEPLGPEAARFTKGFVSGGRVRLQFDRERLDDHGRTLAYVWVGERMLNEELLRSGLARWERNFRYSEAMKRRFARAQREAQSARRGVWSQSGAPQRGG